MKLKVVILAGGIGSRISEESHLKPKPMVDIGGKPILWHIMKIYSSFGLNDFIICGGYKINVIKEYFSNFFLNNNDISFNLENGDLIFSGNLKSFNISKNGHTKPFPSISNG